VTAISKPVITIGVGLALANCSPTNNPPLVFAQHQTFGARLHGSIAEESTSLTVGYKDRDMVIIPVSGTERGRVVPICAMAGSKRDSLSVFGHFKGDAKITTKATTAELNSFFATGVAADQLAAGYNPTPQGRAVAAAIEPNRGAAAPITGTAVPAAGAPVKGPHCMLPAASLSPT
jgi:hypothetical protein